MGIGLQWLLVIILIGLVSMLALEVWVSVGLIVSSHLERVLMMAKRSPETCHR